MEIKPPTNIVIKESPIHGLGVFATKKIKSGTTIEVCSIIDTDIDITKPSEILDRYRFNWPQGTTTPTMLVVTTGYGMLYNHSENPNAAWKSNFENKTFEFYSIKDIEKGEEILVWYGDVNYWSGIKSNSVTLK